MKATYNFSVSVIVFYALVCSIFMSQSFQFCNVIFSEFENHLGWLKQGNIETKVLFITLSLTHDIQLAPFQRADTKFLNSKSMPLNSSELYVFFSAFSFMFLCFLLVVCGSFHGLFNLNKDCLLINISNKSASNLNNVPMKQQAISYCFTTFCFSHSRLSRFSYWK